MRSRIFSAAGCGSVLLGLLSAACSSSERLTSPRELDAALASPRVDASLAQDAHTPEDGELDAGLARDGGQSRPDARAASSDARAGHDDASIGLAVCNTIAPASCPTPATRYADVEPIFRTHCVVCHSPLWTGPWPLDEYQHVSDWQSDIRDDMLDCSMPLIDGGIPITITLEERQRILSFLRCGLPM